jgi:hypothetical protein
MKNAQHRADILGGDSLRKMRSAHRANFAQAPWRLHVSVAGPGFPGHS